MKYILIFEIDYIITTYSIRMCIVISSTVENGKKCFKQTFHVFFQEDIRYFNCCFVILVSFFALFFIEDHF